MGAFLGICAGGTPAKYSPIASQLLVATCDQSQLPLVAQFLYNLMGPIFYELTMMTMMAVPSEQLMIPNPIAAEPDQVIEAKEFTLDTLIKFLCFVYFESALQSGIAEDVFDTLTFCDLYEVAELQEYCTDTLKSLTESSNQSSVTGSNGRFFGKRLCDCAMLFLGGRIPFYFYEEELTLLHSVLFETILDATYAQQSELDMAEKGILWLQRRLLPKSLTVAKCLPEKNPKRELTVSSHISILLLSILVVCHNDHSVNNIVGVGTVAVPVNPRDVVKFGTSLFLWDGTMTLILYVVWTTVIWFRLWFSYCARQGCAKLLYLFSVDGNALEGVIAKHQPVVVTPNAIIQFEKGP